MGRLDEFARNLSITSGQISVSSKGASDRKVIHYAEVTDVEDSANMGRIKVKIIDFDYDTGEVIPGKDRNEPEAQIAYPLLAGQFLNSIPKVGELVFIISENLRNSTSTARFYIGPVRSRNLNVSKMETASSANRLFNNTSYDFNKNQNQPQPNNGSDIPKDYIYVKGKDDSDIIFKSREVLVRAGSLKEGSYEKNSTTQCYVQLIQKTKTLEIPPFAEPQTIKFSQTNIVGSNINLISSDSSTAQNRALNEDDTIKDATLSTELKNDNSKNIEDSTNPKLEVYGEQAKKLHPLVLGDELVELLKTLINFCLNHYHTPQENVRGPKDDIEKLQNLLNDETISKILSKSVRTN